MARHVTGSIMAKCKAGNSFDSLVRKFSTMPIGDVFFVDRTGGAAGNDGSDWDNAISTIALAVAKCTAGKTDVIIYRGSESDTASADTQNINVAGVKLLGAGYLFGVGGASQSVLRAPAAITTAITGKNIEPKKVLLGLNANDIEVAGVKFYQGVLATQQQALVGSGKGTGDGIQHLSVHDCLFQMDIYGWNHTTPAEGIAWEGIHQGYIGYNQFLWGNRGITLSAGGVAYSKYNLVEENLIKGCGTGVLFNGDGGIENHFRKNRILPVSDYNYCGVAFSRGYTVPTTWDENLFEDELVIEADLAHAYSDAGTGNVWRNCYYIAPGGDGAGTLKST